MALSREQRRVARRALSVATNKGASRRVKEALIAAGLVESNLQHLNYGDRDSVGFLQQRPSQGWGPAGEGIRKDTRDFLARAMALDKSFKGTPGQLAQAVQRSAFPERYDQRLGTARQIIGRLDQRGGSQHPRNTLKGIKSDAARETAGGLAFNPGTPGVSGVEALLDTPQKPNVAMSLEAPEFSSSRYLKGAQSLPSVQGPEKSELDVPVGEAQTLPTLPEPRSQRSNGRSQGGKGGAPVKGQKGALLEMFYDPGINLDNGRPTSPIGGHGTHVHAAFSSKRAVKQAAKLAMSLGLRVAENPKWDPVDPVHTEGSFHYQTFSGSRVGKAIDVSGDAAALKKFNRLVAKRFR